MRALFSIVSLLIVLAIVGMLAKKQLSPAPAKPASADGSVRLPVPAAGTTPQQQSQQVRQTLENTMQQARPMPEDN